jgi:hypothetical protein
MKPMLFCAAVLFAFLEKAFGGEVTEPHRRIKVAENPAEMDFNNSQ